MTFLSVVPVHAVSYLVTRSVNTLSWVTPFSQDLTNVDPDIVYCVEVVNITFWRSLLMSECVVTETSYTNIMIFCWDTSMSTLSLVEVMWRGQAME